MFKVLILIFFISIFNTKGNSDYVSILIGDNKGNIIYEENMYLLHPFASVTKLMTALIVVEEVEKGNFFLDEQVPISPQSALIGGSRVEMYWGSHMSLKDLLYASLLHSANNATYALAEHVGGSIDEFVEKMNKKAKELGMEDTIYYTPAGLPPSMNGGKGTDVGTVEDIYKLSIYALKNKMLMEIANKKTYVIDNSKERIRIHNRNPLLEIFPNVTGLKTGYHTEAGYNMTLSFEVNGEEYIVVLFGANSEGIRKYQLASIVYNFDEKKYMEKYQAKKNILKSERETIAIYIVDSLLGTLKEVNRGLLANYTHLDYLDDLKDLDEKEEENISEVSLEENIKEESKEIEALEIKSEDEYIYIDTEFNLESKRIYGEKKAEIQIIP